MVISAVFLAIGTGCLGASHGTATGARYYEDLYWVLDGAPDAAYVVIRERRNDLRIMSRWLHFWAVVFLAGSVCSEVIL